MNLYRLYIAIWIWLSSTPMALAYHPGTNPNVSPTGTSNILSILWSIGGLFVGSILIIILLNYFSSRSKKS